MKTPWRIPILCFQLLLILGLLLGTQGEVKASQYDEGIAAYDAGNYQKALEKFKPLSEQGDAKVQLILGLMYVHGEGVAQDYTEAEKWLRKAAEQGNALAQYNLGAMYIQGQGVPQDYKEAVKWYRKAAEKGIVNAQLLLGLMYANGQGVPQDYVQAHKWFNLSASRSQGMVHEKSVRNRDVAEKRMTPAQVAEAQKLAREWKPKPPQ